jgi:hypothetical protein
MQDFMKCAQQMQIGVSICTSKAQKLFTFLSSQETLKNCKFGSMPTHYCFRIVGENMRELSCSIVPHLESHLIETFGYIDKIEIMDMTTNEIYVASDEEDVLRYLVEQLQTSC